MATDDDFTGPVNLGNPREFTIRQLATLVLEITRSKASVIQTAAGRRPAAQKNRTLRPRRKTSDGVPPYSSNRDW